MTNGEQSILCNCIGIMIFLLGLGIFIGIKAKPRIPKPEVKSEEWFATEAAKIYTLAMEWYDPDGMSHKEISRSLKKMIGVYNHEARNIEKWTYRCPPCFTLEYLGIETEEDKNEKRN